MNDGDRLGKAGQERGFFHGCIPATDDDDVLFLKEETIAGSAPRNPTPRQALFVGKSNFSIARAGGDDHAVGLVGDSIAVHHGLNRTGQINARDVVGNEFSTKFFSLRAQVVHQGRPLNTLGKAREVLDFRGVH
ncbi:unannotated protein [freshwater metagenome]|uniref:Unannotated protein n=1 Tax=freshwater metagenome TaxID=449393 RepID=A0A6J6I7C5_9ZZZZ